MTPPRTLPAFAKGVIAVIAAIVLCTLLALSLTHKGQSDIGRNELTGKETVVNRRGVAAGFSGETQSRNDGRGSLASRPGSRSTGARSSSAMAMESSPTAASSEISSITTQLADLPTTGATVSGRVSDPDGKGVSGLVVTLTRPQIDPTSPPRRVTTTTDDGGSFTFERLEPGRALVAAHLSDKAGFYSPPPVCIGLEENKQIERVDFELARGLGIIGLVHSDRAEPIPGAYVRAELLQENQKLRHFPGEAPHACVDSTNESDDRILHKAASTDEMGYFEIAGIKPEAKVLRLQASADGCAPASYEPTSPFKQIQDVTLKTVAEVLVVASDGALSAPLDRFRYRFDTAWPWGVGQHAFMSWNEPSQLEQPGEAHVRDVPPGQWEVHIEELSDAGTRTGRTAKVVYTVKGENDVVRLAVGVKRSMFGVVVDPSGNKLAGAQVRVYPYNLHGKPAQSQPKTLLGLLFSAATTDGPAGSVTTGDDGSFELNGLTPGNYEVVADTNEYINSTRVVAEVPGSGEPEPVLVQLAKSCTIYGKVTGADGNPMARATVRDGERNSYIGAPASAVTRTDGFYIMRGLQPDRYRIAVAGHHENLKDLTLKPGEERQVDFDLSGRITLSGAFATVGGESTNFAFLYLREVSRGWPERETGYHLKVDRQNGRYSVSVPPGEYILWAYYRDGRILMVERIDVLGEPLEQNRDLKLQLVDVLVAVLDPNSRPYDEGTVCFDQRISPVEHTRMFSMPLKHRQNFFAEMMAGEYRVGFVATDSSYEGTSEWTRVEPGRENTIVINAREIKRGKSIGNWTPTTITSAYKEHRYPAQEVISAAGTYQVMVLYDWGSSGVRIQSVGLVENGTEVARDVHEGWSGQGKRNHIYTLPLQNFTPGAEYAIVVTMRSEGGTTSQGTIFLGKSSQ